MFTNPDEPACPHGIAANHLLVEQTSLGLQNAIVILEFTDETPPAHGTSALVDSDCTLTPRIQAVIAGTNVQMHAQGSAAHTLRLTRDDVSVFDVPLAADGGVMRRPLVDKGLYKVNCDLHLWERAWIYVSPHPYFAVTDALGAYTIKDVPPGHYAMRVWHEGWVLRYKDRAGRMEYQPMGQVKSVKVRRGETSTVIFDDLKAMGM